YHVFHVAMVLDSLDIVKRCISVGVNINISITPPTEITRSRNVRNDTATTTGIRTPHETRSIANEVAIGEEPVSVRLQIVTMSFDNGLETSFNHGSTALTLLEKGEMDLFWVFLERSELSVAVQCKLVAMASQNGDSRILNKALTMGVDVFAMTLELSQSLVTAVVYPGRLERLVSMGFTVSESAAVKLVKNCSVQFKHWILKVGGGSPFWEDKIIETLRDANFGFKGLQGGILLGWTLLANRKASVALLKDNGASLCHVKNVVQVLLKRRLGYRLRELVEFGADVKGNDNEALMVAVELRDIVSVKSLITFGADANARGGLALITASGYVNADILKILLESGGNVFDGNGGSLRIGSAGVVFKMLMQSVMPSSALTCVSYRDLLIIQGVEI
ncbi:hypothetical protein HDU76_005457, partial [Blyttiomyces sp. JEL0837]